MSTPVVIVEQTSKRLKAHIPLSVLSLILGIAVTLFGANADKGPVPIFAGIALIVGGLVWLAVTKLRVWWAHK